MSRFTPVKIHVCFMEKTEPFIYEVHGRATTGILEDIEKALLPGGYCDGWMEGAPCECTDAIVTIAFEDEPPSFGVESVEFLAPGAESEEPGT